MITKLPTNCYQLLIPRKYILTCLYYKEKGLTLIILFLDIEKSVANIIKSNEDTITKDTENTNPFEAASQLQIEEDLDELKLQQQQSQLHRVENLQEDVEDLHSVYSQLHEIVGDQKEQVENIEANVESTHENVNQGLVQIIKAHK